MRGRYLRVVFYFARLFLSFIGWNLVLGNIQGWYVRATNLRRHGADHAQRFRSLALNLGGVLIKLGQFLSIRVDVLPPEVTVELRGLQDEVPAEAWRTSGSHRGRVRATRRRGVQRGSRAGAAGQAASLAQVHLAQLKSGEEVVVKVQRRASRCSSTPTWRPCAWRPPG